MLNDFLNIMEGMTSFDRVIILIFGLLFVFRLAYLFLFTGRIIFAKKENTGGVQSFPISLFMAVRNEEDNLKANIPKLLTTEGEFEVVIVDDYSQDNSYQVLGLLRDQYKKLIISNLNQDTRFSIKLSQNIALKATNNEWVMQVPVSLANYSKDWLLNFSSPSNENKSLIAGYSGVTPSKGLFNHLYRIENFLMQIKSAGYIYNRMPFVYMEENIAFKKSVYFELGGYGGSISNPYANLELLLNSFIKKANTKVLFNSNAAIWKTEKIEKKQYFELLQKCFCIEKELPLFHKLFLLIDEITKLLFLPLTATAIISHLELWPIFSILLGIKLLAHLVIIKITLNHLNEPKIYVSSLVYDLVMPYFKPFYRWHINRLYFKKRWRSKA